MYGIGTPKRDGRHAAGLRAGARGDGPGRVVPVPPVVFRGDLLGQAIEEAIFGGAGTFQAIDERFHDQGLRIRAAQSPRVILAVREYLATLDDPQVQRTLKESHPGSDLHSS